ncbi:MAG: saccharopine dehydrogenase [Cytophagales bacterium]|nr:MAG: saccharopine dehydrogenase [Cytophagales bacterium]
MPSNKTFLLYGANGYTARLIIERAERFGLTPILAGRDEAKVKVLAMKHHLEYRVADLGDANALDAALEGVGVVLHCAGPFSKTAGAMQQACLRTQTHYLDITGEVAVFEGGKSLNERAKAQGIMIMSGVGFDVVPTDCMALHLKNQLPDATHLQLAFANDGGSVSRGTALTAVENLGAGGLVRENGQLRPVPNAYKTLTVNFEPGKTLTCATIPWGDLATAHQTTGIPNIETYMSMPPRLIRLSRLGNYLGWLLGSKPVQTLLRDRINSTLTGPDEAVRNRARSLVWGRVRNGAGQEVEARLNCPEGYTLTADMALIITRKVLEGNWKPGYQTPAGLYGEGLVLEGGGKWV